MGALDDALFDRDGWFALDAENRRVPGVVVPGLQAGLKLVGHGPVASVVGRVRAGITVIDIDLVGDRGHGAAEAVARWCAGRSLWSLVRPSGGADGRYHVFVAVQDHAAALTALLQQLRASLGASAKELDSRRHVRPLSAPHRTGVWTRPLGVLSDALAALPRPQRPSTSSPVAATDLAEALAPRPRPRRDLPPPWQRYLETGQTPQMGGVDHSRSTAEVIVTAHMVRAGYTAPTAWAAILAAHPGAMSRARASQSRWVRWVWNRAVREDSASSLQRRGDLGVYAAVERARERLWELQWSLSPRRRATLLLVGHHVLDRMARTGGLRVPVPERDLVLDTGISDRKTIRAALHTLDGTIGTLLTDCFDPTKAAESSFEFEIQAFSGALSQIPPPSLHTPVPPAGVWGTLPRSCHALWRILTTATEGLDLATAGNLAGLSTTRTAELSPAQVRTVRHALHALAAAELAVCTAEGLWIATGEVTEATAKRATVSRTAAHAQVSAERAAYRARASTQWSVARAAALKANRAREQGWWESLSPTERTDRRRRWATKFAELTVLEQEIVKANLVDRRARAGQDEATRHRQWIDGLSQGEYLERSVTRQRWFEGLPQPLQHAYVAAWSRHRARYGIPRGSTRSQALREHDSMLPGGERARDKAFLQDQLDLGSKAGAGRQSA